MQNVIYFVKKLYKYLRNTLRVFRGLNFEPNAVIGKIGGFRSGTISLLSYDPGHLRIVTALKIPEVYIPSITRDTRHQLIVWKK